MKGVLTRQDRAQVIKAGIELLGGMESKKALDALAKESATGSFPRRARVLEALGRTRSPEAVDALLSAAYDEDTRIRTAALLAMEHMPAGRCDLALVDGLSAPQWPVRSAATFLLARRKPMEAAPKLVARMRPGVEPGRLLADVRAALVAISGKRYSYSHEVWKRWLDEQEGKEVNGEVPASPPRAATGELAGVHTYARRILFVLASSRSMVDEIVIDPRKVAPLEVRQNGGPELAKWTSVKTKMELARLWLGWAVENLAPEVTFNVITYSSSPNAVFSDLVPATKENRRKAARRVSSLSPSGEADIFRGLMKIYTLLGKDPLDKRNLLEGPEVVYFVSDANVEIGEIREGYRAYEQVERLNLYRRGGPAQVEPGGDPMETMSAGFDMSCGLDGPR